MASEEAAALFFREAALRICGHLEAHESLARCLRWLRTHVPVDRMFLETFDPGSGAMRTIATADVRGGRALDALTALSPEARGAIEARRGEAPISLVFNDARAEPAAVDMYRHHGIDLDAAGLLLVLGAPDAPLGNVVFISEGERYTPDHAELLVPLRELFTIAMSNALEHREVIRLGRLLADDNRYLKNELDLQAGLDIIGSDQGLRTAMSALRKVAPTDSVVLLLGETGVGKDVLARALHRLSPRAQGPFITVNCGAIPESLIDSELFGYEKGAFTGAQERRRGRFERAEGGTLFLDEVGELTPAAQVRLLRALQNQEIERVGGTEAFKIDVRIVAATHRSLEEMVRSDRFREDLWYRLNVFPIRIPPLRDRIEDVPALVRHFVEGKTRSLKLGTPPPLETGALLPLERYGWPGNVRELEHVVERALILCRDETGLHFRDALGPSQPVASDDDPLELDEVLRRHIRRVLDLVEGRIEGPDGAAARLGINASTLRSRMRKLDIARR
ncbi:MAG: sigma 54-interacting transcriptional regulator [Myxococcota bacterium]